MGEARLDPLLQQLQNILDEPAQHRQSHNTQVYVNLWGNQQPYQSAGDADHGDGSLGRLGDIKQVVEQRLVLVVGKQVELIQDKQHRAAAAAIS